MIKPAHKKILKTTFYLLGIFIIIQIVGGLTEVRMSKGQVKAYFAESGQKPVINRYRFADRTINYAEAGSKELPTVIFIHGAPGSWTSFINFLADSLLLNHAHLIAVDRPGHGHSDFGDPVVSIREQARLLKSLIDKSNKPVLLVGHSLGGAVAARVAMDYPDLIDALILVAPSIDPGLEPDDGWWRQPFTTPYLSWILPVSWSVANVEIYHLKEELMQMMPLWKDVKMPVTIIQGLNDELVPPGNVDFAKKMLTNSENFDVVIKENANHFIPWDDPKVIREAILKYIKGIRNK